MTRLLWSKPTDRQYETGLDRGVLYPKSPTATSPSTATMDAGTKIFTLTSDMRRVFKLGSLIQAVHGAHKIKGLVSAISATAVTIEVTETNVHSFSDLPQDPKRMGNVVTIPSMSDVTYKDETGTTLPSGTSITLAEGDELHILATPASGISFTEWTLTRLDLAVPWNGLVSVDESSGDSATAYYLDGRPFLWQPQPKEFSANLKAFTYPDAFAELMGLVEIADGLYVDSQIGDSFDLCYRTLVGDGVRGDAAGYKIHIVYNATVTPPANSYATNTDSINNSTFSWDIQAVPMFVSGYRPTAHIVIDTRHMEPDRIAAIEALLYGDDITPPTMPTPQTIYDVLNFGDRIIITDNGNGTWTAEGSYENIYMIDDGVFQIDNVNAVINGDGTYDISSTP